MYEERWQKGENNSIESGCQFYLDTKLSWEEWMASSSRILLQGQVLHLTAELHLTFSVTPFAFLSDHTT